MSDAQALSVLPPLFTMIATVMVMITNMLFSHIDDFTFRNPLQVFCAENLYDSLNLLVDAFGGLIIGCVIVVAAESPGYLINHMIAAASTPILMMVGISVYLVLTHKMPSRSSQKQDGEHT